VVGSGEESETLLPHLPEVPDENQLNGIFIGTEKRYMKCRECYKSKHPLPHKNPVRIARLWVET
jgi:hypothetical protein